MRTVKYMFTLMPLLNTEFTYLLRSNKSQAELTKWKEGREEEAFLHMPFLKFLQLEILSVPRCHIFACSVPDQK